MSKKILLDGDVIAYRCAWSEKDTTDEDQVLLKVEELLSNIRGAVDPWGVDSDTLVFLTGKGNYRYDIAKTAVYKGNRKDTPKPQHLGLIREHLILEHDAIVSEDCEADDLIGIHSTHFGYDKSIIVSIDKDFEQIPTTIFNPTKWEFKTIDPWTATKNFYKQILMGDIVDNIIGLWRIGPVKADEILSICDSEKALYAACLDAYMSNVKPNTERYTLDVAKERVLENARLLWIQREYGELWQPPR